MGEKETATAADAAAGSGTLNVAATPGGSAGILSAAVSSVGQMAAAGADPSTPAGSGEERLKGNTKTQGDFTLSN